MSYRIYNESNYKCKELYLRCLAFLPVISPNENPLIPNDDNVVDTANVRRSRRPRIKAKKLDGFETKTLQGAKSEQTTIHSGMYILNICPTTYD